MYRIRSGKNATDKTTYSRPLGVYLLGMVLLGVGLGTLISMVGVGRAIAGFNFLCKRPLLRVTGMDRR